MREIPLTNTVTINAGSSRLKIGEDTSYIARPVKARAELVGFTSLVCSAKCLHRVMLEYPLLISLHLSHHTEGWAAEKAAYLATLGLHPG